MKIGILTFHKAYNYGAVLQAFALQKKLAALGCESEIIDYRSIEKRKKTKLFSYNTEMNIKGNVSKFIRVIYRYPKNKNFDLFMSEEMSVSPESYSTFYEMEELDKTGKYDTYIVGSDQVWNFNNNCRDKTFLLSFCHDNNKKNSYAASIGNVNFDSEMMDLYTHELSGFHVLSVREESSINEFDFLKNNHARAAIDPTLLLEKNDYIEITSKRIIPQKYAFLYTIGDVRNLRSYAKNFCVENNLKLIDSKHSSEFFLNSSPRDFLSFIYNAEYVFTNSFHGTAFSIIFQKYFGTEINTKTGINNRSFDLMKKTDLLSRDIDSISFNMKNKIDYNHVNKVLDSLKNESFSILNEIIEI